MLREFTIKINGKYRLFIKYVSKLRNRVFLGFENEFLKVRKRSMSHSAGICQRALYGFDTYS